MPESIDRHAVQRLLADDDVQLVDVLTAPEYEELHLPDAINLPLRELARRAHDELDPARPVIVYCHDSL